MITVFLLPLGILSQILYKCPSADDIQSDFVKSSLNISLFADGKTNYEIAYKDITQPRICKCITGRKSIVDASTSSIYDDFQLECGGRIYKSNLTFVPYKDENAKFIANRHFAI